MSGTRIFCNLHAGLLQRLDRAQLAEVAARLAPGAEHDRLVAGLEAELPDGSGAERPPLRGEVRADVAAAEGSPHLGHVDVLVLHEDALGVRLLREGHDRGVPGWPIMAIPSGFAAMASRSWLTIFSTFQPEKT